MKTVVTHVGRAEHGEHRYFGHAVLSDLLGRETSTGLMAMAILERRLSPEDVEMLDALAVAVTAADPRIWPLKVARLVASYGETLAGFAGYGIPLRERDERFEALRAFIARGPRATGAHWRAQEALSQWMWTEKRLAPNIGIGLAAALLDLGCSPAQAGALATFLIEHTFAANAFEAARLREPLMQRLPEDRVEYVGRARRESPRASAPSTTTR